MAGYSKGIVDTRKLNKDSKAKLGRGGDTKIREVDGRESHVNALEAYLIDVNGKAGEDYAKRVGAGTVNPLTGMPEYHPAESSSIPDDVTSHTHYYGDPYNDGAGATVTYTYGDGTTETVDRDFNTTTTDSTTTTPTEPIDYSYEGLKDVTEEQLTAFDEEFGAEDLPYFQDIFSDKPFDFLDDEKSTALKGQFLEQRKLQSGASFAQEGIEQTRDLALGGLVGQEKALGLQMEGISRTAGRGLRGAGKGREQAIRGSNMAYSGTIAQAYETQKKDLFQDYTAGAKGVQLGMEDIGRQRTGVLGQYDIQKRQTAAGLGFGLEGIGLAVEGIETTFDKGTYNEQQRQLDEYWEMIGLRQSVG